MVKLTDTDRRVLQFSMLRADWSISQLSAGLGLREHVVRNSLHKLKTNRIIRTSCAVDQNFFGLTTYNVLLSLQASTRDAHKALCGFLDKRPGVGWAIEVGGNFQYEFTLVAESPMGLASLFHDLYAQLGLSIAQKALVVEYRQVFFGIRYPDIDTEPINYSLCVASKKGAHLLDDADRRLLAAVTGADDFSTTSFARALGLPASTVAYKMTRLQSMGVISAPTFSVNYYQLGLERSHLLIACRRMDEDFMRTFTQFCSRTAGVYAVVSCVGAWDCKVVIVAENQRQTKSVIDRITEHFGDFFSSLAIVPCYKPIHISWHSHEKQLVTGRGQEAELGTDHLLKAV